MDKNHLPYNVLLIITIIAIGLILIFNFGLRQSDFAILIGYVQPPAVQAKSPPPQVFAPPPTVSPPALTPPQLPDTPIPVEPLPLLPPPIETPPLVELPPLTQFTPEPAPEQQAQQVTFPLELNRATSEQLQLLSGIGPVTAQRIIDHRAQIGGFTHLSQLMDVSGIGPVTFGNISPFLYVTGQAGTQTEQSLSWEEYLQAWEENFADWYQSLEQ